jgi:cell division protein FtsB
MIGVVPGIRDSSVSETTKVCYRPAGVGKFDRIDTSRSCVPAVGESITIVVIRWGLGRVSWPVAMRRFEKSHRERERVLRLIPKNEGAVMNRFVSLLFAVAIFFSLADDVAAQEASVEQLTEKLELLKKENELLIKENELLKKEIEQMRVSDKKRPSQGRRSLGDLFVVGAKLPMRTEHVAGPTRGMTGVGVLTITSRDGDAFTATNSWRIEKDGTSGSGEIQGKIMGANMARWRRVDAPNGPEVVLTLRPDGNYIETLGRNPNGLIIKGVIDVSK